MKKNILTVLILSIVMINMIMTAVLVFAIVPSAQKTNKLVGQVASAIHLELQAPGTGGTAEPAVVDIADRDSHTYTGEFTMTLKKSEGDSDSHYAQTKSIGITLNKKSKTYGSVKTILETGQTDVEDIVSTAFSKFTKQDVDTNKEAIKKYVIDQLNEHFQTDAVIGISFGNIVAS